MIGIGVVGYGYWGPNLVRNFSSLDGCEVRMVSDLDERRLGAVKKTNPGVRTTNDYRKLITDPGVQAVAIATPVSSHHEIALAALRNGKHVFIEKPMASSAFEAAELTLEARRRGLTLMVDHTFVYTGAVRKIKQTIQSGELGEIYYYDSVRVNLGLFQHDVNVLWDLAVHDLSIMDYVLPGTPLAVSATGISHIAGQPEDMAFLTVFYDRPLIAHLHVNWLAPVKVRRTLIGGSQQMIVYDDVDPSEKVKIYDKGVTVTEDPESIRRMRVGYRTGDIRIPNFDRTEALRLEAQHFTDCIANGAQPLTGGEVGTRVVRILEAAQQSLMAKGTLVELGGVAEKAA